MYYYCCVINREIQVATQLHICRQSSIDLLLQQTPPKRHDGSKQESSSSAERERERVYYLGAGSFAAEKLIAIAKKT